MAEAAIHSRPGQSAAAQAGRTFQYLHSGSLRCSTGQAVQARRCGDISLAYMDSTSPHIFSGETQDAFERVREAVRTPLYGYGMCCLNGNTAPPVDCQATEACAQQLVHAGHQQPNEMCTGAGCQFGTHVVLYHV